MNAFNRKGQGALEYLLLIAAAVLVSSVVIIIMTGSTSTTKSGINSKLCEFMDGIGIQCSLKVSCSNNGPNLSGGLITLSAAPSGGNAPYTYSWQYTGTGTGCSFETGFDSSSQNPVMNCEMGKNYPYTVTVTDSSNPKYTKTCETNLESGCYVFRQLIDSEGRVYTDSRVTFSGTYVNADLILRGGTQVVDINWSLSDYNVLLVPPIKFFIASSARFNAKHPGSVTVTATPAPGSGCLNNPTIDLNVVTMCSVIPNDPSIQVGQSQQFNLMYMPAGLDAVGNLENGPAMGDIKWYTNQGSVASISSTGLATGLYSPLPPDNWADIFAYDDPFCLISGHSRLTVMPETCTINYNGVPTQGLSLVKGSTTTLTLNGADGQPKGPSEVNWESTNPSAATIGLNDGVVNAIEVGNTTINGTSSTCGTVSIPLDVSEPPPPVCSMIPPSASIPIGSKQGFWLSTGTGPTTWDNSAPAVASLVVQPDTIAAEATALSAGSTTISASNTGCTASAALTVTTAPAVYPLRLKVLDHLKAFGDCPAAVLVNELSNDYTTNSGKTFQLCPYETSNGTNYALYVDLYGTYTSANPLVFTAGATGQYNALSVGTANATYTSGTKSATIPVTVAPASEPAGGTCATDSTGVYKMCIEVNKGGKNCVTAGTPPNAFNLCVEVNKGGNCVTSGNYSLCVKVNNG